MEGAHLLGGRYTLFDHLGVGGMAVVWRARDEVLGRAVAVKVLAGKHSGAPDARDRIRAEARAAAALSHPNIAQVYDYGEARENGVLTPYVVMELVRGGTLQQRMDAGPMSARFAMRVAAEVAAALAAAHADGLVHRDIKPANVMVTEAGAKVVDFGIAAAVDPAGSGNLDDEVFGTPAYLAPERLTGDGVEPASDVYALGVLLYRMLSGHSPWSADTTTQMLSAHVYLDPEPLPERPGVPGYITDLCNRCLSKDPTRRPSAREVAALLAQGAGLRVVEDAAPEEPDGGDTARDSEPSVLIRRRARPPAGPAAAAVAGVVPAAVFTPGRAGGAPAFADSSGPATLVGPAGAAPASGPAPSADAAAVPGHGGGAAGFPIQAGAAAAAGFATPNGAAAAAGFATPTGAAAVPGPSSPVGVTTGPGPGRGSTGPGDDDARRRRRRRMLPVLAAVLLLMSGGLLWWLLGPDGSGTTQAVSPVVDGVAESPTVGPSGTPSGAVPRPGATGTDRTGTPDTPSAELAPGRTPAGPGAPPAAGGRPTTTTPAPGGGEPVPTTTAPVPDEPGEPEPEPEPEPVERTFTSSGGTVRATCTTSSTAKLLSWSAAKPYKVNDVDEGPGSSASATFKHGNRLVRTTVTCAGGEPSGSTDDL